ncbi:MAG: phage portal protein [Nitrospira sp. SB0662_bin_26]|nr:phage portal protein [Nitrospira sp. SB0662_bin_26]
MWPFTSKKKVERRDVSYSDELVNYIVAQAGGSTAFQSAIETAAVESCAGAYARAFAAAMVSPSDNLRTMPVTAAMLSMTVRELIRKGEIVFALEAGDMGLTLVPCSSFTVETGDYPERTWMYRVDLPAPTGWVSRLVSADSVLHFKYACDPRTPWRGLSPLRYAESTGRALGRLEKSFGDEAGAATGFVLPMPQDHAPGTDTEPGAFDKLRTDIQSLNGKTALVETTAAGHGEGRQAAPLTDWKPSRLGPMLPDSVTKARDSIFRSVLAACGVPVGVFDSSGSSQEGRESWRRFVFGSCVPVGRLLALELSTKLDLDISLSFDELQAHDLSGRAASFKKMVEGGMDLQEAVTKSGLMALQA